LDRLLQRLLRLSITPVAPMLVHHPRTTARTHRPLSSELIFSKLNRGAFAKSSTPIKSLYFGLHGASPTRVRANVADPRSPRNLQRYNLPLSMIRPPMCSLAQRGLILAQMRG